MNKKSKVIPKVEVSSSKTIRKEVPQTEQDGVRLLPLEENSLWQKVCNGWMPYVLISVLGLVLYCNTFHHEFALDDDIIVCKNEHVLKGLSGMGDIMTKDVFDSYYKSMNLSAQLAGGRYRPFAVATYALEQEIIGTLPDGLKNDSWDLNKNKVKDPSEDITKDGLFTDRDFKVKGATMRHVNNVLLYILGGCILFLFLSRFFFKENKLLALLTVLLFMAHPLHSEVVANIKSRDEILSLMFMVLALYFSFLYMESKDNKHIAFAALSYFIALLSKEYGASLVMLVPLGIYVYYKNIDLPSFAKLMGALLVTFGIYYYLRSGVVLDIDQSAVQDSELLNNPYLLADENQAKATKAFINLKYFLLLLLPWTMSSDYSYNVIPYKDFSDISVILSILLLIGSFLGLIYTVRKRHWLAFPIAFALIHLCLVNNMFFNIGATMGERLVYHTSFGTCILLVFGLYYLFTQKLNRSSTLIAAAVLPLLAIYSFKTIARNPAWKNDYSLTLTDVKIYPNSALLNGNACNRLIELSEFPVNKQNERKFLDSATKYGHKALQLHPRYVTTYMNMGMIKFKIADYDSSEHFWSKVIEYFPTHPNVPQIRMTLASGFYSRGLEKVNQKKPAEALGLLQKAYNYTPDNPKLIYDLGVVYNMLQNQAKAKELWLKGLQYAPNDPSIMNALRTIGAL